MSYYLLAIPFMFLGDVFFLPTVVKFVEYFYLCLYMYDALQGLLIRPDCPT